MIYKKKLLLQRENYKDRATICILKVDAINSILSKIETFLHPEEIEYYKTFKYDKRRLSYLSGRMAAKYALEELLSIKKTSIAITRGVFDFPVIKYLVNQNGKVSISHCDSYASAIAFPEEHPMGVDIEEIDIKKIETIDTVVTENEKQLVSDFSLEIGYTILWTAKESLSKVLKTGLMIDFKFLEIEFVTIESDAIVSTFKFFPQYKAVSFKYDNFICSIVLPKNTSMNFV